MRIDVEQAGDNLRVYARSQIKEALLNPEIIYNQKQEYCPIYIKGDVAVPYDDGIVPTVYTAGTFTRKIEITPDNTPRGVT